MAGTFSQLRHCNRIPGDIIFYFGMYGEVFPRAGTSVSPGSLSSESLAILAWVVGFRFKSKSSENRPCFTLSWCYRIPGATDFSASLKVSPWSWQFIECQGLVKFLPATSAACMIHIHSTSISISISKGSFRLKYESLLSVLPGLWVLGSS